MWCLVNRKGSLFFGSVQGALRSAMYDAYENDIEQEACSEVANQVKGWRKNTQAVIGENEAFFGNLADVTDVYVLGRSMAEVDLPYFERVRDVVNEGAHGISLFMVSMTDKGRNR